MAKVELTDVERLFLANQYEILGLLKKEEWYTRMAKNLRDGHKWIYQQHAVEIAENLPDTKVDHVLTILGIYSDLRDSYRDLDDKSGIEESDVQFTGFDGNNEADLLHFAQALTEEDRFRDTIGRQARNSHMPTTDMYRRMIEEWLRLGRPRYPYSREAIQRILAARIHPDHRP